jgi:uncharacterized MAPEG superfamily protein
MMSRKLYLICYLFDLAKGRTTCYLVGVLALMRLYYFSMIKFS